MVVRGQLVEVPVGPRVATLSSSGLVVGIFTVSYVIVPFFQNTAWLASNSCVVQLTLSPSPLFLPPGAALADLCTRSGFCSARNAQQSFVGAR